MSEQPPETNSPPEMRGLRLFQREKTSLFGEVLDWMLVPLLLVFPASLVLTWAVAEGIAARPFDRALEQNVQALARLVTVSLGETQLNLPGPARQILRTDDADSVYYQVKGIWGEYVAGERNLPLPEVDAPVSFDEVLVRSDEFLGEHIRVAHLWVKAPSTHISKAGEKPILIQVAETLNKRHTLTTSIIKGVSLPQILMLPLIVMLVWLALSRGTRPLRHLESSIRARKSDDVSPMDTRDVPQEVKPLIASVNDLLTRLQDSVATQKRFLADAAHQLKTPLAGLRMQADLALRSDVSAEDLKHSLVLVGRSSVRATRTVNQLLALARAEATGREISKVRTHLIPIVIEAVQDALPQALDKRMDLGFDDSPRVSSDALLGNPVLLKELVRNLLENAINYTPHGGVLTARVLQDPYSGVLALQVEDDGPGIAPEERERVMQPFYRTNNALGNQVDGSGLGLAIVQTIARQHNASVQVEDAHEGYTPPGTRFTVRFEP